MQRTRERGKQFNFFLSFSLSLKRRLLTPQLEAHEHAHANAHTHTQCPQIESIRVSGKQNKTMILKRRGERVERQSSKQRHVAASASVPCCSCSQIHGQKEENRGSRKEERERTSAEQAHVHSLKQQTKGSRSRERGTEEGDCDIRSDS